jgi:tripartite-type tricarboxylate transporter receptor subunit TctC
MHIRKQWLCCLGIAAVMSVSAAHADTAEDFPQGAVKIVVPFPAGGSSDTLARIVAERLQAKWGQVVIVENRTGASTIMGVNYVAKSPPDGRTLCYVNTPFVINPSLHPDLPYDTLKDLTGVIQLAKQSVVLLANNNEPFNTVPELIAYAKKHPGKLTYASPGVGTATHLAGEMLARGADIKLLHVPYKGNAGAQMDLIGGRVNLMFDVLSYVIPRVQEGKVKIIALTSRERNPAYKQYPVIAETIPNFNIISNNGIIAPSATPRPIIDKIQKDIATVLSEPETRRRISDLGLDVVASSTDQYNALIKSEIDMWGSVIREANVTAD